MRKTIYKDKKKFNKNQKKIVTSDNKRLRRAKLVGVR